METHRTTYSMANLDEFFKSAFTVDNVIFGFDDDDLKVLLIKRGEEPFIDEWALPGYFVYENEDLDSAAYRVLKELTGLENVYLEQVKSFGAVDRHPAGRVITVAYFSLINAKNSYARLHAASIAQQAKWISLKEVNRLAFDHNKILETCFQTLQKRVRHQPIGFELLPQKFTLSQLRSLYETILLTDLDKRNFRKKIHSMNLLIDLQETQEGVAHRPAKLYRFDNQRYQELVADGFVFDITKQKRKK